MIFHRLVTTFTSMWTIERAKHIRSDKDNKSNHGRRYVAKQETVKHFSYNILNCPY